MPVQSQIPQLHQNHAESYWRLFLCIHSSSLLTQANPIAKHADITNLDRWTNPRPCGPGERGNAYRSDSNHVQLHISLGRKAFLTAEPCNFFFKNTRGIKRAPSTDKLDIVALILLYLLSRPPVIWPGACRLKKVVQSSLCHNCAIFPRTTWPSPEGWWASWQRGASTTSTSHSLFTWRYILIPT